MTFFSLSMIGIIQKLAPVFTVIMAYAVLSEKLTNIEILLNVIAIAASLLVTIGDHHQNGHNYDNNRYIALVFLILNHRNSKWAVTEKEMPGRYYPDFLSGW